MGTINQNLDRPLSAARPPEPFEAFAQAVSRGEVCLDIGGDSVTGEIAGDDTWREILVAAGAYPSQIEGVVLTADGGEIVRLHRLVGR